MNTLEDLQEKMQAPTISASDSINMARSLITEQMLRWKSAMEASREAAPGSDAYVWVSGYVHGLQQALDWLR